MAIQWRVEHNGQLIVPRCDLHSYKSPNQFMHDLVSSAVHALNEPTIVILQDELGDENMMVTIWNDVECPTIIS